MGPLQCDFASKDAECLMTHSKTACRAISAERRNVSAEHSALERWVCDWSQRMCKMLEQRCESIKQPIGHQKEETPTALQTFLMEIGGAPKAKRPLGATEALQRVEAAVELVLNGSRPRSPTIAPKSLQPCSSFEACKMLKRQTAVPPKDHVPQLGVPRPKGPASPGCPEIGDAPRPRLPQQQQSMQPELKNREKPSCIAQSFQEHGTRHVPDCAADVIPKKARRRRPGESLSDLFSSSESESEHS